MQITTKTIIKILPFDLEYKEVLYKELENSDPDRRFYLERLLWDAYDVLFEIQLQENIQKGLLRAKENKENLDADFYARMEERTEKEMAADTLEASEKADLEEARQAMEVIVKEIQAVKQQKH